MNPSKPHFIIGDTPFRFVGAFVPAWHGAYGVSETAIVDEDLIVTAKAHGISVLNVMAPPFENPLGVYSEKELRKVDHFLDAAARHGIYVMISFVHGWAIGSQIEDPYYHPGGIEGIITDERLASAFKQRINALITRQNLVNGRLYRNDPTIFAWIIAEEVISAPWNYRVRPPNLTVPQLNRWINETASYIKGIDRNHLVTINTTAGIDSMGDDWLKVFDATSLDFVIAEDAEMRILNYTGINADGWTLRFPSLGKPVVVMLSYTGLVDQQKVCDDHILQAQMLRDAMLRYFEVGMAGIDVVRWSSDTNQGEHQIERCFTYTKSSKSIILAFQEVSQLLNVPGYPFAPLQFIKIKVPRRGISPVILLLLN
jgi:hypothetical protein